MSPCLSSRRAPGRSGRSCIQQSVASSSRAGVGASPTRQSTSPRATSSSRSRRTATERGADAASRSLAEQLDARHDGLLAGGQRDDLVADADGAAGDAAGVAAAAAVLALGADDPLHGHAQRAGGVGAVDRQVLEAGDERRAGVPRRDVADGIDDVVALERADRDADEVRQAEPVGERAQLVARSR